MFDLEMHLQIQKDIDRAFNILEHFWRRDSYTLCHGICGNLWILENAAKRIGRKLENEKEIENMKFNVFKEVRLLPQEERNPGFMNGYGGILFWLICEYENMFINKK